MAYQCCEIGPRKSQHLAERRVKQLPWWFAQDPKGTWIPDTSAEFSYSGNIAIIV